MGKYGALDFVRERLGSEINLEGKNKYQRIGKYEFAIMYSRMVPLAVESGILTGLTGEDWFYEYSLENPKTKLRIVERLPFGRAKVVAFKDNNIRNWCSSPLACVTIYPNIAAKYLQRDYPPTYIISVPGETESWVKAGLARLGIDNKNSGQTIDETNLKVIDEIFDSAAVIISKERDIDKVKEIWGLK